MPLKIATTFNGLPVCPKCGWAQVTLDFEQHVQGCQDASAGANAAGLASRLPELPSTKFGYGDHNLTFEPDTNLHIRLTCSNDGSFRLEDVWLLDTLTMEEAASFVRAIADWRRTHNQGQIPPGTGISLEQSYGDCTGAQHDSAGHTLYCPRGCCDTGQDDSPTIRKQLADHACQLLSQKLRDTK